MVAVPWGGEYNRDGQWRSTKMKVPAIVAVMVLGAASMMAQAAATSGTAAAPDAAKPAEHAACKHETAKTGAKKSCHCTKNKDGMAKDMDESKHGGCPMMKKSAENKS
jgi:anti-sigma-K factor RskA